MILPEFVFLNSKILPFEFLLHTRPPYLVARALRFENSKAKEDFIIKHNLLDSFVSIPGYHILLCFYGDIDNVRDSPVLGHKVRKEDLIILEKLKEFYEAERIKGNESRLKKYANR